MNLYRRTNQTAIRQTLSKNVFSPTNASSKYPNLWLPCTILCLFLICLARLQNDLPNA